MREMRKKSVHAVLAFLVFHLCLCGRNASAEFAIPALAPVDRLIRNTQAYLDAHPNDPEAIYHLGRIHYMAFMHQVFFLPDYSHQPATSQTLQWVSEDRNPKTTDFAYDPAFHQAFLLTVQKHGFLFADDIDQKNYSEIGGEVQQRYDQLKREGWKPPKQDPKRLQEHAAKAVVSLKKAVEMDPTNALYYLTLASFAKQYLDFVEQGRIQERPAELKDLTMQDARNWFHQAYSFSIDGDLKYKAKSRYNDLSGFISYEAGIAYLALVPKDGQISRSEGRMVREVKKNLKTLERLPRFRIVPRPRIVTPIIFSLRAHLTLAELLDLKAHVPFDLDGNGVIENWSWVGPDTGILVWDPDETGRIVSGRQMFGNATWWVLYPDGYAALYALDDNRDGWLRGSELKGISAWFDRNSNGRSDKGEVVGLNNLGILAINTHGAIAPDGTLMSKAGLILSSGAKLPTYDWMAETEGQKLSIAWRAR